MNEKILFLEIKERWQQEYVLANSADLPSIRFEKNGIAEAAGELRDVTVHSPFINSKILKILTMTASFETYDTSHDLAGPNSGP